MMAATPLASVEDLAGWLGEPIADDADKKRAGWLLRRASSLVNEEADRIRDPWTAATVPPGVQEIVLSCAARAYDNPEGWTGERLDDWMGTGKKVDEAGLFLTATERRALLAYAPSGPSGVGILRTTREVWPPATLNSAPYTFAEWERP